MSSLGGWWSEANDTPGGKVGILVGIVVDMIVRTGTVGVTLRLCMPGQTHKLPNINLGQREGRKVSLADLCSEGSSFDTACLEGTKQCLVEVCVFKL